MPRRSSTRPILSALICTYDREALLRLTLESLCRQTLRQEDFEVVVVDDGSTDGTREVVRAFEARLPLRYSRQRNAGLASARNHAVFCARGDLLLFLDDDDVADPSLLEEHVAAHRAHPAASHGVLGYTGLDPSLAADPLMRFVTEVGCFMFSYPRLEPGVPLDFGHFWGGRSSCKRSFLLDHGVFNPVFRFGCEDVELAFRLSKHGFVVFYEPRAVSTMVRRVTVDDMCRRLDRQGQSNVVFARLHPAEPAVQRWTELAGAAEAWAGAAPAYEGMVRSARELDRTVRTRLEVGLEVSPEETALLHRSYWAAFRASKVKGIVAKAKELGHELPAAPSVAAPAATAPSVAAPAAAAPPPRIRPHRGPGWPAFAKVLKGLPGIHVDGKLTWSITEDTLWFLEANVAAGWRTLETGSGASTLLFAFKQTEHTCITPVGDEVARLKRYCADQGIGTDRISFIVEKSQDALPRLDAARDLDLVLIDGGHGFPVPFVDWFFTAAKVKVGGLVIVDDTQLWTGEVLRDFLLAEPEWRLEASFHHGSAFRKVGARVEKEWNEQPYVLERSDSPERPRKRSADA